jgi:hypothetical protein
MLCMPLSHKGTHKGRGTQSRMPNVDDDATHSLFNYQTAQPRSLACKRDSSPRSFVRLQGTPVFLVFFGPKGVRNA